MSDVAAEDVTFFLIAVRVGEHRQGAEAGYVQGRLRGALVVRAERGCAAARAVGSSPTETFALR
jgi:hypothetical protein